MVFIATFNNLSVVSQCMKLSFIGGAKQKKNTEQDMIPQLQW
jgi:hypothetical protein